MSVKNIGIKKITSKIFLYNITDYYYAIKENGLDCMQYNSAKTDECFNSWFLDKEGYYFSMVNYGSDYSQVIHYSLGYMLDRGLGGIPCYDNTNIKPVFYIINNIDLTGIGTIDNPFIIN